MASNKCINMQAKDQVEVTRPNVQPDYVHLVISIPPKYAGIRIQWHCDYFNSTKTLGDDIGGVICGQSAIPTPKIILMLGTPLPRAERGNR